MSKNALIIFTRNAETGKVKTRLAATLGNDVAFYIYKKLVAHTHAVTQKVDAGKFVFYSSYIDDNDEWDNKHFMKRLQKGNDLGERMYNAFDDIFREGYSHMVIIGSDCPGITNYIIDDAFKALDHTDVVLGPAKDGGYYLLALKRPVPELFKDIAWSTGKVLAETLVTCSCLDLPVYLLPELSDVDVEDDIKDLPDFLEIKIKA